jgi:hypothetical protein
MCVAACAKVPQQSALTRAADSRIAADHLRATENSLAITVPGDIETSADEIMARSDDPAVRRQALRWKMEAIPAYYQTLFQANSLAAAMDTLVLAAQIEDYLATGPGHDRFGSMQPAALEAARKTRASLIAQIKAMAERPEAFERVLQRLNTWARANPIAGPSLSSRPSAVPVLVKIAGAEDQNVFGVVGDISSSIADVATRIDVYTAYVPKATRWQADLLAGELADLEETRTAVSALASLQKLTDRVDGLTSRESIDEATNFAVAMLRTERAQVMDEIDQMRLDVLAYVRGERVVVMTAMDAAVKAALADVDRHRTLVEKQIDELRRQTLADVEHMRQQTFVDLDELTNRVILKAALMVAAMVGLAALLATIVVRTRSLADEGWPRVRSR